MRTGPARSFWLSFVLTLAVVVPVLGGFAMYVEVFPQTAPAEQVQSGVPINRPAPKHTLSVLAAVAGETPAFVLARLDAPQGIFEMYTLPAQTVVLTESGACTLAEAYASAGPARAARLLGDTLGIPLEKYLAAPSAVWGEAAGAAGGARVNLDGLLTEQEREAQGLPESVLSLNGPGAAELLGADTLPPPRLGALRAGVWQAFARQNSDTLGEAVTDTLRQNSGSLLTNLTGVELYTLKDTLEFLREAEPRAQLMPGHWEERAGHYALNEEAVALARSVFGSAGDPGPQSQAGSGPDGEEPQDEP